MTYKEIQKKLEKCELALTSIQNGTYTNGKLSEKEALNKLTTIKESLEKKLNLLKEEETMFVSTKGGDTKAVSMDTKAAMDLKKDPNITGITTAKGKDLKEDDLSDEEQEEITTATSHTEVVAKEVHKALIDALQDTGHEVSQDDISSLNPETFTISIRFKDNTQSDYSFEFVNGEIKLDGNIIVTANKKGITPVLNKTIAKNNLVKYFQNLTEKKGKDLDGDGDVDSDDYLLAKDKAIKANMKEEETEFEADAKGKPTGNLRAKLSDKDKKTLKKIEDLLAKEKPSKFKRAGERSGFDMRGIKETEGISEGPYQTAYVKVSKRDYKKAISIIDQNIDSTYVKTDIVDDDGAGNVIIYFNFREREDEDLDEDPGEFIYALSMHLEDHGISVTEKSHELDEDYDPDQEQLGEEEDKMKEHISVGHPDNEPGMLKQDVHDIAHYAVKLYKLLKYYESLEDQVDFPHWWQSKVVKAREYISKAAHYLEFKTNEPAIDAQVGALQEDEEPTKADMAKEKSLAKKAALLQFIASMQKKGILDKDKKVLDKDAYKKALDNFKKNVKEGRNLNELSTDQRNDLVELQNILDDVNAKGEEAREIIRQSFPNMLSKADAYGAFNFGSSANRYDTTLESIIEEIEEYYDEEDMDEGKYKSDAQRKAIHAKKAELKEEMDGNQLLKYFKSQGYDVTKRRPDGYPPKEGVVGYQVTDRPDSGRRSDNPQTVIFQYNPTTDQFTISQMSGYMIDQKDAIKAGMRQRGMSSVAGIDSYITDGNYNPVDISAEGLKDIVDHVMGGLEREAKAQSDFYKDRGPTSGTIDEDAVKELYDKDFNYESISMDDVKGMDLKPGKYQMVFKHKNGNLDQRNYPDLRSFTEGGTQFFEYEHFWKKFGIEDKVHSGGFAKRHQDEFVDKYFDEIIDLINNSSNVILLVNGKPVAGGTINKENRVADKDIEKEIKKLEDENPKGFEKEIKKLKVRQAVLKLSKQGKKEVSEGATCCGRCGRVHVKGSGCKRPYLKGKDHCRTK